MSTRVADAFRRLGRNARDNLRAARDEFRDQDFLLGLATVAFAVALGFYVGRHGL